MALAIACDIHPLNNLRVLKYLKGELGQEQEAIDRWYAHWVNEGLAALEVMVPLTPTTREALMTKLCGLHEESGERFFIGLGLYKGLRFHIDAKKFREWGMESVQGHFGCGAVLAEGPMPYVESSAIIRTPAHQ